MIPTSIILALGNKMEVTIKVVQILLKELERMKVLGIKKIQNLQDAKGHQSLLEVSGPFHAAFDLHKKV